MAREEFLYTEKYRPKTVNDCILPARIKKDFQEFVDGGNIPTLLLSGTAGTGKTTIALALCAEVGCDSMIINASKDGRIDTLRTKIQGFASTVSLTGGDKRKIVIMDEADAMTGDTQAALRGFIEEFSVNCGFIFTCNYKSKIIEPIHSRCINIDFTIKDEEKNKLMGGFMKRIQQILKDENVTYDNAVIAQLIKTFFPDFRRTLNELQRYGIGGQIDTGILSNIEEVKLEAIVDFLKTKDFKVMRKWMGSNADLINTEDLFSKLYHGAEKFLEPTSVPTMIILLGEYQFKAASVADLEINMCACLTEIMASCEFKK